MTTTAATLQAVFTADTSDFMRGSRAVDREMGNLGQRVGGTMQNMGASITNFGTSMLTLTAPITAVFGLATMQAIQFESAFAGVEKTVDATDAELAALRTTIRQMATDADNPLAGLDNAHIAIANIMELGGQLGVATGDLDMFAQVIGELGLATNLTTEEAAIMSAQFANISGMSFDNLDRFGATIVALGNNSATTERDIMNMASRIVAAGSQAGISERDILAFSAAMSSSGLTAELAGTNFSKFIGEISLAVAEGGGELDNFAMIAGMSADDFATAWGDDATGAITQFLSGLGEMSQADQLLALQDLGITGTEATRVLTSLAANTDLLTDSLDTASDAWTENTALTAEAEARLNTTAAQMNVFKNRINDAAITVGDALIPVLIDVMDALDPIISGFAEFVANNPEIVSSVAIVAAGLTALATAATVLGTGLSALGSIVTVVGAGITAAFSPVLAIIAAGIAIGVALYFAWQENFLGIQDIVTGAIDIITSVLQGLVSFVEGLANLLSDPLQSVGDVFDTVFGGITSIIGGVIDTLNSIVGIVEGVVGAILGIPAVANDVINAVGGHANTDAGVDSVGFDNALHMTGNYVPGLPVLYGTNMNNAQSAGQMQLHMRGNAAGTPWTGSGATSDVAGLVHMQEAVVPAGGMQVIPSPRGLMIEGTVQSPDSGGGGRTIVIQRVDVHGVQDAEALFNELERIGMQRAAM